MDVDSRLGAPCAGLVYNENVILISDTYGMFSPSKPLLIRKFLLIPVTTHGPEKWGILDLPVHN